MERQLQKVGAQQLNQDAYISPNGALLPTTKVNLDTVHAAKEEVPPDIGFPTGKAESLSPSDTRRPFFLPFARHAHSGRTLDNCGGRAEGPRRVEPLLSARSPMSHLNAAELL